MDHLLRALSVLVEDRKSNSQHLDGGSQPPATPAPGDPWLSPELHGHQTCTWYTDIHAGKTLIHIIKTIHLKNSCDKVTCGGKRTHN